jgi:RNA polymerase sigma-70 factor (ECF subfamily)
MTMNETIESLFARFRRSGDAAALAAIFDRTAAELGRVAMYLAGGDAQAAADALQATWLSAITHAARWDSERPLLPWLLGMLANHVRSHQRVARRSSPAGGAGAEALATLLASDDPVRASQDGEFQRLLADALAELPGPFREVVTLHVQHGLTAKEIGEALGRPAGTVRTQIVRGLERLRQRLPVGLAGAGFVVAALTAAQLAKVRDEVLAEVAPAPFAAARAMSIGLVVAAVLAIAVALALRGELPPAPLSTGAMPVAAGHADAAAHEPDGERVRVAAAPQDPRPATTPRRRITVQVRRAEEPHTVAGEWVCLNLDELRLAATDAAGNAVFDDVPPSLAHYVFLSGVGESAATVPAQRLPPPQEFDQTVTIDVSGGEALCVRVVDAAGKPVAGAEVDGNGAQNAARTWLPLGRTDERGELRLRNQHLAQYRARAAGHGTSPFASPAPASDGHMCTLALAPAIAPLRGRVVDAEGKPIAAQLGTYEFGNGAMAPWYDDTDAGGAFTFAWVGAGHVAVVARAAGGNGMQIAIARVEMPRSEELVIRLQPAASLDVTTLFADGRAAPKTMVRGRLLADGAYELPFSRPQLAAGDDGRLWLAGLAPGRWQFEVDFGQVSVQRTFDLAAGIAATWTAQAAPLHELRLRLLDERGAPLENWNVHVLDAQQRVVGGQNFTSESGELWPGMKILLPPDRPFTIAMHESVEDGGNFMFPAHKVPGVVADGARLDVVVPDSCRTTHRVRGRLVDAQGAPVAGSLRVVSPLFPWQGEVATAAADGSFALGPLPPGRYAAEVLRDDKPPYRLARIEVPSASDLDLGDVVLAAEVRVRASPADGNTVPDDVRLELVRDDGRHYDFERGDGGELVSEAVPAGRYTLRGSGRTHFVATEPIVVGASDVAVTFRCAVAPTLRIEIPLLDDERAQAGWSGTIVLRAGNDEVVRRSIWHRFRGRVPTPFVVEVAAPPGSYTVVADWSNARELRGTCELGERGGAVTLAR